VAAVGALQVAAALGLLKRERLACRRQVAQRTALLSRLCRVGALVVLVEPVHAGQQLGAGLSLMDRNDKDEGGEAQHAAQGAGSPRRQL
jgi:hypothetical protein